MNYKAHLCQWARESIHQAFLTPIEVEERQNIDIEALTECMIVIEIHLQYLNVWIISCNLTDLQNMIMPLAELKHTVLSKKITDNVK